VVITFDFIPGNFSGISYPMDLGFLMVYSAVSDIQYDLKMLSLMLEISLSQVFADCEAFTYQQG
jgi:hypothetical protein